MTSIDTGLAINRDNTARYIALWPTEIILIPRKEIWVAGSKRMVDQNDRDPQTFHVIWSGATGIVTMIDGVTHRFDFILVGEYTAEVAIRDHWILGTQDNEIDYIFPFNGYEVKCGGSSYGSNPTA
jgi:hypothetical protein